MGLTSPLCLSTARKYFESRKGAYLMSDVPSSLSIVGIISGYRREQYDPDFTQVHICLTQGLNEEFRMVYEGKFSMSVCLFNH